MEVKIFIKRKFNKETEKTLRDLNIKNIVINHGGYNKETAVISTETEDGEIHYALYNYYSRELLTKPVFDYIKPAFPESWLASIGKTNYVLNSKGRVLLSTDYPITISYSAFCGVFVVHKEDELLFYLRDGILIDRCENNKEEELNAYKRIEDKMILEYEKYEEIDPILVDAIPNVCEYIVKLIDDDIDYGVQVFNTLEEYGEYMDGLIPFLEEETSRKRVKN